MEKQVWIFRLLNSASLSDLESVEILLHHLASLAAPTHYVALQVDHCQLELEMIWWTISGKEVAGVPYSQHRQYRWQPAQKKGFLFVEGAILHNITNTRLSMCDWIFFLSLQCISDHQWRCQSVKSGSRWWRWRIQATRQRRRQLWRWHDNMYHILVEDIATIIWNKEIFWLKSILRSWPGQKCSCWRGVRMERERWEAI